MQFVLDHWEAICGLVFAALTYFFGRQRGIKKERTAMGKIHMGPSPRTRKKTNPVGQAVSKKDAGFAEFFLVLVLLFVPVGLAMSCAQSWTESVRDTITIAHASTRAAMDRGMPAYEDYCRGIARACGESGDRICQPLKDCHQRGDAIVTAYSAANGAMAMVMLTLSSIEMIDDAIERASSRERLELEEERGQLIGVAKKQLQHAQRQARRVAEELEQVGAL